MDSRIGIVDWFHNAKTKQHYGFVKLTRPDGSNILTSDSAFFHIETCCETAGSDQNISIGRRLDPNPSPRTKRRTPQKGDCLLVELVKEKKGYKVTNWAFADELKPTIRTQEEATAAKAAAKQAAQPRPRRRAPLSVGGRR